MNLYLERSIPQYQSNRKANIPVTLRENLQQIEPGSKREDGCKGLGSQKALLLRQRAAH